MSQNAGGKQIQVTVDPTWDLLVQFKYADKPDIKKRIWEFHMNEGCLIAVWYDRFDAKKSPHKTIEVWPLADIAYTSCAEITRPEPTNIIVPKGILPGVN